MMKTARLRGRQTSSRGCVGGSNSWRTIHLPQKTLRAVVDLG